MENDGAGEDGGAIAGSTSAAMTQGGDMARRKKQARGFRVHDGVVIRFEGVKKRFVLPLKLPKGVKARRIVIDDDDSTAVK